MRAPRRHDGSCDGDNRIRNGGRGRRAHELGRSHPCHDLIETILWNVTSGGSRHLRDTQTLLSMATPTLKPLPGLCLLLVILSPLIAQPVFDGRPSAGSERPRFVWDRKAAAHLMRRAGFSSSPGELDRIVAQGWTATLEELLNFELVDDSEMEEDLAVRGYQLARTDPGTGQAFADSLQMNRWWFYRMIHSKRQLLEKMTLFWHDHFATSVRGVRQVDDAHDEPLLMMQNRLLRRYALGNFKFMVHEMARDPAMLIWLDNFINFPEQPNENWARELLELFTMGVGRYGESDVQEAARAFTGWTLEPGALENGFYRFHYDWIRHDFGRKTSSALRGTSTVTTSST